MALFFYSLILLIGIFVLVKSGAFTVGALSRVARAMNISEYVISFILLAFATTLPEFFVAVNSALQGESVLSLGNVIGSNIVNLTLIVGLIVVFSRGIELGAGNAAKKEVWPAFSFAILPFLMMLDMELSRVEGIVLVAIFLIYLGHLIRAGRVRLDDLNEAVAEAGEARSFLKNLFLFLGGVTALLFGAYLAVKSAVYIAEDIGIPLIFVGFFIVALGTSLPELTFGIRSVVLKHGIMPIGNLIGSTVFNSIFILGVTSIINPIKIVSLDSFAVAISFMILTFFLFGLFVRTKDRISLLEGMTLIFVYLFFIISEVFFGK